MTWVFPLYFSEKLLEGNGKFYDFLKKISLVDIFFVLFYFIYIFSFKLTWIFPFYFSEQLKKEIGKFYDFLKKISLPDIVFWFRFHFLYWFLLKFAWVFPLYFSEQLTKENGVLWLFKKDLFPSIFVLLFSILIFLEIDLSYSIIFFRTTHKGKWQVLWLFKIYLFPRYILSSYFIFCFGFPWNLHEFFHFIFQNNSRRKLVSFRTFFKRFIS